MSLVDLSFSGGSYVALKLYVANETEIVCQRNLHSKENRPPLALGVLLLLQTTDAK